MDESIIKQVAETLKHNFKQRIGEAHYVIKYLTKDGDKFLGYHLSSQCQLTQDKNEAKRYGGDPYKQLGIISENLKLVLGVTEEESKFPGIPGMFHAIHWDVKNTYFSGYKWEDLYLDWEPLSGFEAEQELVVETGSNSKT